MRRAFGAIAPEHKAQVKFDSLEQIGDVESNANESRKLVRLMTPMKLICPSEGDIVCKFIQGLKPDLKEYLVKKTPFPYWQSANQCFNMAIARSAIDDRSHVVRRAHVYVREGATAEENK